jgi:hypothetical protein
MSCGQPRGGASLVVAGDGGGNLFFADREKSQVLKWNQADGVRVAAGDGTQGFSGDGGPAISARLGKIAEIAADASGNLFIGEVAPPRIRKVTPTGVISTVAGNGTAGFKGDGGPATAAALCVPTGLAANASGVFIALGRPGADSMGNGDFRIRRIAPDGSISTFAGNGTPPRGARGAVTIPDGGMATSAPLYAPLVATGDSGDSLFVVVGAQVRKINPQGMIFTVAQPGVRMDAMAVDKSGNVFVSDFTGNQVRRVTSTGTITTVAGNGTAGFSGDGGPATSAQLTGVNALAMNGSGDLFIVENQSTAGGPPWTRRIRRVDSKGIITTIFTKQ